MELLWAVNGDANEPMVLREEIAPLIRQQRAVGLDDIGYLPSARVFALQLKRFFVERQWPHQRLAPMPGKQHLRHGLGFNVLTREPLKHFLRHDMALGLVVEILLLQIITVFAPEVTGSANRL